MCVSGYIYISIYVHTYTSPPLPCLLLHVIPQL